MDLLLGGHGKPGPVARTCHVPVRVQLESRPDQMVTPSRRSTLDLSPRSWARKAMMPRAIVSKSLTLSALNFWRSSRRPWMKRLFASPV